MLQILLIPLSYLIGFFAAHYSIDELKNKDKIFEKIVKVLSILLIIAVFYYSFMINYSFTTITFFLAIILFHFLNINYTDALEFSIIGLILGVFYSNNIILLAACALTYFTAGYDYLNNKFFVNSLKNLLLFLFFAAFSSFFNNAVIAGIASAGLIRLLRK